MSWLAEPAFEAERAPIARWAVSLSLTDRAGAAAIDVSHTEGLQVEHVGDVTVAAAGIEPNACLPALRRILLGARPEHTGLLPPAEMSANDGHVAAPHCWVALVRPAGIAVGYRDALGRLPLFWHRDAERLLLTADSERIAELAGPRRPNAGALIGQLSSLWGPAQETYLDGVRRVPSGKALVADARGERLVRHWDPFGGTPPGSQPLDRERFRAMAEDAVAGAVRDARVGIYLSGGLDSVGVAALATSHSRATGTPRPRALSVDFSGSDFDESATQVAVASALGLEQTMSSHEELSGGEPLEAVLELASTMPAPPQNFFLAGFLSLGRRGADSGCAAILTGTGGDEWLGVTPALAADLISRGDWRGLLDLYRTVYRSNPVRRWQAARAVLWRFGARALVGTRLASSRSSATRRLSRLASHRHRRAVPSWIAPGAAGIAELDRRFYAQAERRPSSVRDHYATEIREGFDHPVATIEAEEHVEHGRRIGVPLRHPFLDPRLVHLLSAVRPADLNDRRRSKAPLRDLVANELPGMGFETQRKPIAAGYVSNLVSESGPRAYERLGGLRALAEMGVVDPAGTDRLVETVRGGSDRLAPYRLWEALSLEAWARPRL